MTTPEKTTFVRDTFDRTQDLGWVDDAACRDEDPELFFPVSAMGPGAQQAEQAKAVCARCPVREQCLSYALESGLDFGVFGGLTQEERRELARKRRDRNSPHAA
ncbi:WhiB family transcriptional regulator [Prauserella rugosa]|uniref:Transcriptional regulator WhiB n=1 Tax=Prauserella rugosa TaxID=43354 RepID=A0A660CM30_9PSEU|nr:WhiB family transcriptional regulator [Prauserella rugosa]KID30940.1 Transcription factor WhiB [Prauserella sp. Am3]TWH22719.1 WhiB family redox-sensing transcriptional regulator [Prauserella rugosa]